MPRDEFRKRILSLRASHHMRGVVMLHLVLALEAFTLLLQQQRLYADYRAAMIVGDHASEFHGLGAQLRTRHQMIQQTDAECFLGFYDARGEQQFLSHRPADLRAE